MALLAWVETPIFAAHNLPIESSLPGKKLALKLPSESLLPGGQEQGKPKDPRDQLPSEQTVPKAMLASVTVSDLQIPKLQELQDGIENRPRLRLDVHEHTSEVHVYAFDKSSRHLFTGGDDKVVHHWTLIAIAGTKSQRWVHEETIRWQVGDGQSGRVRALACDESVIYMAGYGAMGGRGEIIRYDWKNRVWLKPWNALHRSPLLSLSVTGTGKVISLDEDFGIVQHSIDDSQAAEWLHKPEPSAGIKSRFAAVCLRDKDSSVRWLFEERLQNPRRWQVREYVDGQPRLSWNSDIPNGKIEPISPLLERIRIYRKNINIQKVIPQIVSNIGPSIKAMAASPDGKFLAVIDDRDVVQAALGNCLYVYEGDKLILKDKLLTDDGVSTQVQIAWSPNSNTLAVLQDDAAQSKSRVQYWDVPKRSQTKKIDFPGFGTGIGFSPDGQWLFFGGNNHCRIMPATTLDAIYSLPERSSVLEPQTVAFASKGYNWSVTHPKGKFAFDPVSMRYADVDAHVWQTVAPIPGYKLDKSQVTLPNNKIKKIDFEARDDLKHCWVPADSQSSGMLLVVPDNEMSTEIHAYSLSQFEGEYLKKLAVFNGHEGEVLSLSVSSDKRLLISCGRDRQVRIWPLFSILLDTRASEVTWRRYGAIFELNNGTLTIADIDPAGPLFGRGVRVGSKILQVSYTIENDEEKKLAMNDDVLTYLNRPDFSGLTKFKFSNDGLRDEHSKQIQLKAQWRPLCSQVFDHGGEWAAWTEAGYYMSSFNGNSQFGWQINNGLNSPPAFYRADRFQAVLDRPAVMKRVLELGSVEAAARATGEGISANFNILENSIALQPTVIITSPQTSAISGDERLVLEADVSLLRGSELASVKAYANGVPAKLLSKKMVSNTDAPDREWYKLAWQCALPADLDIKLQVIAASSEKLIGAADHLIRRESPPKRPIPRLWLISGGVGHYQDSKLEALNTPESNATSFAAWVESNTRGIFRLELPNILIGSELTHSRWTALMEEKVEQLRNSVRPDDVIVVFLSGHGIRDSVSDRYYYVTADARFRDLSSGRYDKCLSIEEISPFNDLPCRKVVVLDTCHSAAFQPLETDRLRTAVRALQSDLVFTLTAAGSDQPAAEIDGKSNSLFTEAVGKAFMQPIDSDGDLVLSWPEFVNQVQEHVNESAKRFSKTTGFVQTPTFVPLELLPYARMPIAKISNPVKK